MLISPTERPPITTLGTTSSVPEQYGVDVLTIVKGVGLVGIQRKELDDLLASVADGRLQREVAQMVQLSVAVLVIEGRPQFTLDGGLITPKGGNGRWTRQQLRGLLWSVRNEDIWVDWSEDAGDTVEYCRHLESWLGKTNHDSLHRRPKAKGAWGKATSKEWERHLMQSFPGVGPRQAASIVEHFGGVPLQWTVDAGRFMEVEGIGKKKAEQLIEALRHGNPN